MITGQVAPELEEPLLGSPRVVSLERLARSPEDAFQRAAELVEEAARTLA